MTQRYNGWTNYETWLANIWLDTTIPNLADDFDLSLEAIEDGSAAQSIREWFGEVMLADAPESGFMADAINAVEGSVNWQEIARNAAE